MKAFQNLRRKVGAMIGGFEGGLSARRLKTFAASRAHVNTLIQAAGADMTARARYLIRNNGYAANAVESWAGNAVGTGIKPSSGIADAVLKDRVQRLWLRWTDESDAEGLTDFYGQQRRAARELFIAGEVFFRIRPRRPEDGLSVPLQLQMLPAEMLPLKHNQALDNGHRIRQGIEFDRIGRRVAYHFLRRHPGDITDPGLAGETVRVPAESVLHIVDPVDAGQLRGVSAMWHSWAKWWRSTARVPVCGFRPAPSPRVGCHFRRCVLVRIGPGIRRSQGSRCCSLPLVAISTKRWWSARSTGQTILLRPIQRMSRARGSWTGR